LVLPRQQKTRGRCSVFAVYEVNRERVRGAFLPGQRSLFVIGFLRQIRRWYPEPEVWVVWEQEGAHPCQWRATRQAMRERKRHGGSLPQGSPDDHPVETLFSDGQLMILDNSNEAEALATKRRISAHGRGRKRRRDRHIRIPYRGDSDKL
jgi:transposase